MILLLPATCKNLQECLHDLVCTSSVYRQCDELQAKLGNPSALVSNYKYTYPAEHFDVPVNVDPSLQVFAEGTRWYLLRMHTSRCTTRWQSCTWFLSSFSPLRRLFSANRKHNSVSSVTFTAENFRFNPTWWLLQHGLVCKWSNSWGAHVCSYKLAFVKTGPKSTFALQLQVCGVYCANVIINGTSTCTHCVCTDSGATLNGSWRVIGSTGQIAIHILPFANGLDLIMGRAYSYTNSSAEDTLVDVNCKV